MAEKDKPGDISSAIKEKYRFAKGHFGGKYEFKGNEIDLRSCSLEQAEQFVKDGFPGLEEIPAKSNDGKK